MERKFGPKTTAPRRSNDGNREGRRTGAKRPATRRSNFNGGADDDRPRKYGDDKPRTYDRPRKYGDDKPRTYDRPRKYGDDKPRTYDRPRKYGDDTQRRPYAKRREAAKPVVEENIVPSSEIRLNKFIANSGVCSRREADTFIQTGLVTVNGKIVTELGTKVKPDDDIRFNGERLQGERKVYILMNKPKDFVTTMSDPHAEHTVMDLISNEKCPERVYPVGRLDKSTTGVLLFTNDGALAEKLTHPSHKVKKIYQATLDRPLTKEDFEKILEGIELEDGPIAADSLAWTNESKDEIGIEIHSGRNRIVRRIFESLGYKVKKLDRVYFAGLTKKNVRRGEWRFLEEKEVNILMMGGAGN